MTRLTIFAEDAPAAALHDTDHVDEITSALSPLGITFERWMACQALPDSATDEDVLAAYAHEVARLKAMHGYQSVDVVRMMPDNPARDEMRTKFLAEHIHEDDEVRFFVEGEGMFYLRGQGHLYMLLCTAGDLINVPANTRHWFDMGATPHFTAIRLFTTPDGWVARFTGDPIADAFPRFEPLPA